MGKRADDTCSYVAETLAGRKDLALKCGLVGKFALLTEAHVHSSITSITRYVRPVSIMNFARSTEAVEGGFIAAGITFSVIAGIGSLATLLSWIFFG